MSDKMTPISLLQEELNAPILGHCGLILQLARYNWVNFGGPLPLNGGGGSGGKAMGTIDLIELYWPPLTRIRYPSKLGSYWAESLGVTNWASLAA